MIRSYPAVVCLLAGVAVAEQYKRMADAMARYGYTWEAVKVTTEDGFILTTFHVTGNRDGPFNPTKPPVIIQHGGNQDGADWVGAYSFGVPMHLQLAEAGYDVWIGNNRGGEYCQEHVLLKVDQPEFWAWSWAEMGLYDDVANVKMIKEHSGAKKVFYLGYSQGTVQMLYGLAHREEDFYAANLHKFVALAPCTTYREDGRPESYYDEGLYSFPSIGVNSMYAPGWEADKVDVCDQLGVDACNFYELECCSPISVQSETHWLQNSYTHRFQEFAPDYTSGQRETDLIDIASIDKVPIAMFSGTADVQCTHAQAMKTAATIGDAVKYFHSIPGGGHGYFFEANDEWFMNLLIAQLQVPESDGSKTMQPDLQ